MMDRRALLRHAMFLLGASASASVLGGCAPRSRERYLSQERLALLDEVAELMIPQTDTPGARAAGVPAAFDRMLAGWASSDTQRTFDKVLDDIDARAQALHGAALRALAPEQRLSVLASFDAENLQAPSNAMGGEAPAYVRFKELLLTTYYLSEPGATVELRLEPVPGPWRGDIPLSDVGRAWAF